MAGGMTAGTGPRLGERGRGRGASRASVPSGPSAPPPAEEVEGALRPGREGMAGLSPAPRSRRHCWVLPDPEDQVEPFPGLVAEWRQTTVGWQARVVYALGDHETATVVESWLAADQLRPA